MVLCFLRASKAFKESHDFNSLFFSVGGAIHTDNRAGGHSLQWTKAMISRPAPHWEGTAVINGEMKELKLSDFKGKYLVFFFYPLDFTFVCPTEILAFNDRVKEFKAINTEVTNKSKTTRKLGCDEER